jgi:hypothetical protein
MTLLPWTWRAIADALEIKYEALGWKMRIELPDWTNAPTPMIHAYATDPGGDRLSFIVTQDEIGFLELDGKLNRHAKGLPLEDYEEQPVED